MEMKKNKRKNSILPTDLRSYKNFKIYILEKVIFLINRFGHTRAKICVLSTTFVLSTVLSLILFLVSGVIRYDEVLVKAFALSNTFLTYHITKPYSKLFKKI